MRRPCRREHRRRARESRRPAYRMWDTSCSWECQHRILSEFRDQLVDVRDDVITTSDDGIDLDVAQQCTERLSGPDGLNDGLARQLANLPDQAARKHRAAV